MRQLMLFWDSLFVSNLYVAPLNAPLVTKVMTLFSVTKAFSMQTLAARRLANLLDSLIAVI